MENLDLQRRVADHRAALEAEAHKHRIVEHDGQPGSRQPRLRYQRKRGIPAARVHSID